MTLEPEKTKEVFKRELAKRPPQLRISRRLSEEETAEGGEILDFVSGDELILEDSTSDTVFEFVIPDEDEDEGEEGVSIFSMALDDFYEGMDVADTARVGSEEETGGEFVTEAFELMDEDDGRRFSGLTRAGAIVGDVEKKQRESRDFQPPNGKAPVVHRHRASGTGKRPRLALILLIIAIVALAMLLLAGIGLAW